MSDDSKTAVSISAGLGVGCVLGAVVASIWIAVLMFNYPSGVSNGSADLRGMVALTSSAFGAGAGLVTGSIVYYFLYCPPTPIICSKCKRQKREWSGAA